MTILETKKEYNNLLQRFYKADTFFSDTKISHEEKEMQIENYRKLLTGMSELLLRIKTYEENDVLEGFKID